MDQTWIETWLESVVSGKATMSQRVMSAIEAHGGLESVIAAAQERGVHLVRLTDDHGKDLVAASLKPFTVLC
jgi:hypothetical protein